MISPVLKLFLSLIVMVTAFPVTAAPLLITNAWIKNLPPAVPMRAGYMRIENDTNDPQRIVGVESEVFTAIEIHETVEKNGMMSMQPLLPLVIAAGKTVELAPGGIHLMMMGPQRRLKAGDRVSIILEYDDGHKQTLLMIVKK